MAIAQDHPIRAAIERVATHVRPPWVEIAHKIIETVEPGCPATIEHFFDMAGSDKSKREVLGALAFLTSSKHAIFDAKIYMRAADGVRMDLSPEVASLVLGDNPVAHPETGEMIENPAAQSYIAYDLREDAFSRICQPEA